MPQKWFSFRKKNTFSTSKWWSGGPDPNVENSTFLYPFKRVKRRSFFLNSCSWMCVLFMYNLEIDKVLEGLSDELLEMGLKGEF